MKILYLLFALLFLAFLSQPGNAQPRCHSRGGRCYSPRCPINTKCHGKMDCPRGSICCVP
uniref:Beta-defensin-like protein n=1 Tax=Phalotris mertensi TaxID=1260334 RepID=A0A2K8FKT5_9SAUR|nr:beta-defensin-like protein [Phalotris mertensi]APZ74627.1 beta-defensin-like protein [Phalotris mertensi]APZ74628.1 beta-defensin-like protein [Phalotris mertensi]APZ74630.1 beta-defensin-like protein [Phalotris mertensi]APZ74631.1 beta-defensin-like protein [Phalotris mertensi]